MQAPSLAEQGTKKQRRGLWFLVLLAVPCVWVLIFLRGCATEHYRSEDLTLDVSSDGTQIVFTGPGEGKRDLYILNIEDGKVRPLMQTPDYEVCPRFSPDGQKVAFTVGKPGIRADQLCILDLADGSIKQLTDADENISSPVFMPDGKSILYTWESQYRWGGLSTSWDEGGKLFRQDIESGQRQEFLSGKAWWPALSPDGSWIVWWTVEGLRLAELEKIKEARLIHPDSRRAAFSFDSRRLAYLSTNGMIHIENISGEGDRLPIRPADRMDDIKFSRDGKDLFCISGSWSSEKRTMNIRIWKVDISTSASQIVFAGF